MIPNKVILVTEPDDISVDGIRILMVDLDQDQTQIISEALVELNDTPTIISYVWNSSNSTEWLFDKKHKSDLIIFNADSENHLIIGYLAAQKNSYYFGNLKLLQKVNNSAIYDVNSCIEIFNSMIGKYDQ
jgi:hypothetical protein